MEVPKPQSVYSSSRRDYDSFVSELASVLHVDHEPVSLKHTVLFVVVVVVVAAVVVVVVVVVVDETTTVLYQSSLQSFTLTMKQSHLNTRYYL